MANIKLSTKEAELVVEALNAYSYTLGSIDLDTDSYDVEMLRRRFEAITPPPTEKEIRETKEFFLRLESI